ncbi:MAG: hypothetical protein ACI8WB_000222 [Phenylobacterium sp.]|jgi:hypothetical protein
MMGQVTPPTGGSGYYEDDGDFNVASSALREGWGWGLNQAYATCDTYQGTEPCEDIFGENPPNWWEETGSIYPGGTTGGTGSGSGDGSSGSGGGSGGSTDPETPPTLPPLEECKMGALEDKGDCYTIADVLYGLSMVGCATLLIELGPYFGGLCGVAASAAHTDAKGDCDEELAEDSYLCTVDNP